MAEWWDTLLLIEKVLYCIAIPSTIILVVQTILIIFGSHGEGINPSDTSGIDFGHDFSGGYDFDFGSHTGGFDLHGDMSHDISGHDMSYHGDMSHDINGHDISHDTANHDGGTEQGIDSLKLFTIQGMVAFLCMGSWSGIVGIGQGMNYGVAILTGLVLGFILMIIIAVIYKYSYRLAQDGTFYVRDTLGASGTVYITIPGVRKGQGKVNVMVQNRYIELTAITDSEESINTGETVRIIDIIGDSVVVERYE